MSAPDVDAMTTPPPRSREDALAPDDSDLRQIRDRLRWTPRERLLYLTDMVAFEERARRARRIQPHRG